MVLLFLSVICNVYVCSMNIRYDYLDTSKLTLILIMGVSFLEDFYFLSRNAIIKQSCFFGVHF